MARSSETHDGKVTTGSVGYLRATITTFCRNLKHEHATILDSGDSVVYASGAPPVFLDIKKRQKRRRRSSSAFDVLPIVLEIASFLVPSPTPQAPKPRMKQCYAEDLGFLSSLALSDTKVHGPSSAGSVMSRRYKAAHDPACRASNGVSTLGRIQGARPLGSSSHA